MLTWIVGEARQGSSSKFFASRDFVRSQSDRSALFVLRFTYLTLYVCRA